MRTEVIWQKDAKVPCWQQSSVNGRICFGLIFVMGLWLWLSPVSPKMSAEIVFFLRLYVYVSNPAPLFLQCKLLVVSNICPIALNHQAVSEASVSEEIVERSCAIHLPRPLLFCVQSVSTHCRGIERTSFLRDRKEGREGAITNRTYEHASAVLRKLRNGVLYFRICNAEIRPPQVR